MSNENSHFISLYFSLHVPHWSPFHLSNKTSCSQFQGLCWCPLYLEYSYPRSSFEYFLLSSLNSNVNSKRPLTVPKWDGHQALTLLNMFLLAIINNWNDCDFCVCLLLFFSLLWQKLEAKIVSYFVLRMFILFFHGLSPVTSIFISSKN